MGCNRNSWIWIWAKLRTGWSWLFNFKVGSSWRWYCCCIYLCLCVKVMWGTTIMARATPWNPTGFAWRTTSFSTMDCTGKWRSTWVLTAHANAGTLDAQCEVWFKRVTSGDTWPSCEMMTHNTKTKCANQQTVHSKQLMYWLYWSFN